MKKKMITFFGFMSVGVFFWHSTLTVQYFLGKMPHNIGMNVTGFILVFFMTIHMILALINMVKNAKRTKGERFYSKYIMEHGLQNVSGICIYSFALLHALFLELHKAFGTQFLLFSWLIADVFLYLSITIHLCIALPHILISCGIITDKKVYSITKGILVVISAALFVPLTYAQTVFTLGKL
jgi:succinate dehydrogenase/fumarate reductase cytochrome b subunit